MATTDPAVMSDSAVVSNTATARSRSGEVGPAESLVNSAVYPIGPAVAHGRGRAEVVARHSEHLARTGVAILPDFIDERALPGLIDEAVDLAQLAYRSFQGGRATVYLEAPDHRFDEDHPRRTVVPGSSVGVVAYDQFPADSKLRALFEWEPLSRLVADILGVEHLYRYADPLGALNLAVMAEPDELGWHFDQTDFVVSIALQTSSAGGEFQAAQRVRNADDERYNAVSDILSERDLSGVGTLPMTPGTLMLFQGRFSMHRVTPVIGTRERLVLLLGYDTRPDTTSSTGLKMARYGRLA